MVGQPSKIDTAVTYFHSAFFLLVSIEESSALMKKCEDWLVSKLMVGFPAFSLALRNSSLSSFWCGRLSFTGFPNDKKAQIGDWFSVPMGWWVSSVFLSDINKHFSGHVLQKCVLGILDFPWCFWLPTRTSLLLEF